MKPPMGVSGSASAQRFGRSGHWAKTTNERDDRHATGRADALFGVIGQPVEVHVARRQLVPRRCHADLRAPEVFIGEPDRSEHRSGAGPLHTLGDLSAPRPHGLVHLAPPILSTAPPSGGSVVVTDGRARWGPFEYCPAGSRSALEVAIAHDHVHVEPEEPSPWVVRFAPLIPAGGRVLDVACGNGRHTRFLLQRRQRVLAVDKVVSSIADLEGNPELEVLQVDLESDDVFPLAGRRFEGVVVTNYLYRPLLRDLMGAVAPGGVLIYSHQPSAPRLPAGARSSFRTRGPGRLSAHPPVARRAVCSVDCSRAIRRLGSRLAALSEAWPRFGPRSSPRRRPACGP